MNIEIIGTGRFIPPRRVSNDELASQLDTSDEWIRSHTGIGSRHIAGEEAVCSDLALEAAKEALKMAEPEKTIEEAALSLDLIVIATATSDYYGCPSTACLVQDKLGAKNAGAFDLSAGCTGFVYALETAAGLLSVNSERKRALVIGAEILSKFIDWDDRASCVLFGDGAGAVVIEKREKASDGQKRGLLQSSLSADGSGAEHIIFKGGGSKEPFKSGETLEKAVYIQINGQAVYNFAVKAITGTVKKLLSLEGITIDQVDWIIPHQANARIVQAAAKRLGLKEDRFFMNIESIANTSAASIPIALDELNRSGRLKTGDIILTVGFGGGLTFGGNIIKW